MPSCSITFWTETRLYSTSIERYIVHVDRIGLSMLIFVEVFEQTKPSKYVLFICVDTWMALMSYAAISEIINIVRSEKWPHCTYFWHFALLFQCKKYATSPHITTLPCGGSYTPWFRCSFSKLFNLQDINKISNVFSKKKKKQHSNLHIF